MVADDMMSCYRRSYDAMVMPLEAPFAWRCWLPTPQHAGGVGDGVELGVACLEGGDSPCWREDGCCFVVVCPWREAYEPVLPPHRRL